MHASNRPFLIHPHVDCIPQETTKTHAYIYFQKLITHMVMKTYIYMYFDYPEERLVERSFFIIRNSGGELPLPATKKEADMILPSYFEFGDSDKFILLQMQQMLDKVRI